MNAMDYPPIAFLFWFCMGGLVVVFIYTVTLWLLTRGDRILEEEQAAATAPLLLAAPTESSPA